MSNYRLPCISVISCCLPDSSTKRTCRAMRNLGRRRRSPLRHNHHHKRTNSRLNKWTLPFLCPLYVYFNKETKLLLRKQMYFDLMMIDYYYLLYLAIYMLKKCIKRSFCKITGKIITTYDISFPFFVHFLFQLI